MIDKTQPLFTVLYGEQANKVADDFVQMINSWQDEKGRPSLAVWKEEIDKIPFDVSRHAWIGYPLTEKYKLVSSTVEREWKCETI